MKYIEYYPQVLKEVYEIQLLGLIFDKIMKEAENNKDSLRRELYLSTATGVGLEIWESILNIIVTDEDVEARRFKIRSKLLGDNTTLRTKLDMLIGNGKYKITAYPSKCHILFNLELSAQGLKMAVKELLEKTLPVNLTYEINLSYNKHLDLKAYTHKELSKYTHKDINAKKIE